MYQLTLRDMYQTGTDTIIVTAKFYRHIMNAADPSLALAQLETIYFTHPYIAAVTKI